MVDHLSDLRKQQGVTPQQIDTQPQQTNGAEKTVVQESIFNQSVEEAPQNNNAEPVDVTQQDTPVITEKQEELAAESREARAESQKKSVEVENVKAEISKELQKQGQEVNANNIEKYAQDLIEELETKRILEKGLSVNDQKKLDALNEILGNNKTTRTEIKAEDPATTEENDVNQKQLMNFENFLMGQESINPRKIITEYLNKHDPEFSKLNPEQQRREVRNKTNSVLLAITGEPKTLESATNIEKLKLCETMIALNATNMSIEDFASMDETQKGRFIAQFESNVLQKLVKKYTPDDIPEEEFKNYTPEQKLFAYIDKYLSSKDPAYNSYDQETKDKARRELIDNVINNLMPNEQLQLTEDQKNSLIVQFAEKTELARALNMSLTQVLALKDTGTEMMQLRGQYREETGIEILAEDDLIRKTYEELANASPATPTDGDIIAALEKAAKDAPNKELYTKAINKMKMHSLLTSSGERTEFDRSYDSFITGAKSENKTNEEYASSLVVKLVNAKGREKHKIGMMLAAWASENEENSAFLEEKLRENGFYNKDIEFIKKQVTESTRARHTCSAMLSGDANKINFQTGSAIAEGNVGVADKAQEGMSTYISNNKDLLEINNYYLNVRGNDGVDHVVKDRTTNMSFERAEELSRLSYNSNDLSDTTKSCLAKKTIEEFGKINPEYQKGAYQTAVDSGNLGAMEGAAASESSLNSSIKQECTQYLDNALNSGNYTSEQREVIMKARQTGQTASERGESYPEGFSTSSSSSSSSSSGTNGSSGTHSTNSSSGSSNSSNVGSNHNTNQANGSSNQAPKPKTNTQAQQDYAQAVTEALQLRKEEAMKKCAQIIENYQKSVKEREERKAKEAQKLADAQKADAATSTSTTKSTPDAKAAPNPTDKKAADEIAQTFTTSEEITSSIAPAKIEELRQAYQTGGAASLYDKLGSVSATYQEKFLNYFAEHANSADLCNFASAHSGNKNVILALYQRSNDPALLQYLGEANVFDLMGKGKIKLQDFMRFASPDMVAKYLLTLKQTGNTGAMKDVLSLMSFQQREETSQDFAASIEKKSPLPGSDDWMRAQQAQMAKASAPDVTHNDNVPPKIAAQKTGSGMLSLDRDDDSKIGDGMLSLNGDYDEFSGLALGSNRVRMGQDIKKRDKRFFRMG